MRMFKLPIFVTIARLGLTLILVITTAVWIDQPSNSNREKELRAQRLGSAATTLSCLVIAPFLLHAVIRFGQKRRSRRSRQRKFS